MTAVPSGRSWYVTMRPAMSAGCRPALFQTTLMTGIRTSGKMSVGVRTVASGSAIRISSAWTMNV
ncbi:hypothetical protein WI26_09835 [Burkholderia diffusa]|nr:hypothetical protein WI26_09835 [Burkholderia diffusa]